MIAHLSYVMCDQCGDRAPPADKVKKAQRQARLVGFIRLDGRDLCCRCWPPQRREAER